MALIIDVRDVADFATRFEIYAGFADYGDAAHVVFERIANEYRGMVYVHGQLDLSLSLNDMCDLSPRGLVDGEVLDIGGALLQRRMVEVATPHVPHNWEAHLFHEQVTGTLFCGDLCSQIGDGDPVTSADLIAGRDRRRGAFSVDLAGACCQVDIPPSRGVPAHAGDHARILVLRRLLRIAALTRRGLRRDGTRNAHPGGHYTPTTPRWGR